MNTIAVVVPACGDLRSKALGPSPLFSGDPLTLPVGGRLAIDPIRRFHATHLPQATVHVAIDESAFERRPWRSLRACRVLDVGRTGSVCETLLRALERVEASFVIVNPVTTIPTATLHPRAAIGLGREAIHRERWSAVRFDASGTPIFLPRDRPDDGGPSFPFTGLISSSRTAMLEILHELDEEQRGDLLHLAEGLHRTHASEFVFTEWIDAGHRATFARSRQLAATSRAFNRITLVADGTLVEKRSTERRRLAAEGRYLAELPPRLRHHFPMLHRSEPDDADGWRLVQEYVPLPTLAETFLHWDVGPNAWERIFDRLAEVLDAFAHSGSPVHGDGTWLYSTKCRGRFDQMRSAVADGTLARLGPILEQDFSINGRSTPSLERSMETLLARLEPLEVDLRLQRIHGDLCLANILCDPTFGVVKLIDPRGREDLVVDDDAGVDAATLDPSLGDPRYDLAKLNHSFEGLYDSVVNDLFRIDSNGRTIELDLHRPPNHTFVLARFRERLLEPAVDRDTAAVLTASLFLSMIPLHAEDPERALAFAAIGSTLLHDRSMRSITGTT